MVRPIFLGILLATATLHAQVHTATPVETLMRRHPEAHYYPNHVVPPRPPDFQEHAARSFNVVARSWVFDITPAQFVVNRGDSVTITVTASDNGTFGTGHGFAIERYSENLNFVRLGQTLTLQFIADTIGQFTYFCTQSCGDGHTTMFGTFTVVQGAAAPTITNVSPNRGSTKGHTNVVITGTNFQSGATVKFGNVAALDVDVNSATSVVAETPPQNAGVVNVTVTNPDQQSATRTQAYTYVEPEPQVLSVSPSSGPTAGGTNITINGVDFKNGATVRIGSRNALNVVFVNDVQLTAKTPLGPPDVVATKSESVTVTNPDGRSGTKDNAFTWTIGPLTVGSISPQNSLITGGTIATITGTGFSNAVATTVLFGGVAATNVQVVDAVTILAHAPPHAAGTVDVEVRAGSASATAAGAFTYLQPGPKRRSVKK